MMRTIRVGKPASWSLYLGAFVGALLLLSGCREAGLYDQLGPLNTSDELAIGPAEVTLQQSDATLFTGLGGSPPYSYAVTAGTGAIDAATGIYNAPASLSTETVTVTDSKGKQASATVRVVSTDGALSLTPLYTTVPPGQTLQFVASGGSGASVNYLFDITSPESGGPVVDGAGLYTAGNSEGTDVIRIRDSLTGESRYARVAVAVGSSNVDYRIINIDTASLSAGGTIGSGFTFVAAFQIENAGTDNGSSDLFWRVYHSTDGSLGNGDTLLDEGSLAGGLTAGGTTTVDIAGTWPIAAGAGNLFVTVNALDDGDLSNNVSSAIGTALDPLQVDNEVSAVSLLSGTLVGEPFDGSFTVTNLGSDNAVADIRWFAYYSTDTLLDGTDILFDSGTLSPLGAGLGTGGTFNGTWDSPGGPYYFIVEIEADDDTATANNSAVSAATTTVTVPQVDYDVLNIQHISGTVANRGVSGEFDLTNSGTDAGTSPVYWTVYASPNTSVNSNTAVVATGVNPSLPAGGTVNVPFSGVWPKAPDSYYLVVEINVSDDVNAVPPSNLNHAAAPIVVSAPQADFVAGGIGLNPGTTAGGSVSGNFTITNNGPGDATSEVAYVLYASTDGTLDSLDYVIGSGTQFPFLTSDSLGLPFSGTWPSSPGSYTIIGEVLSIDDPDSSNNIRVEGTPVTITAPTTDYTVDTITPMVTDPHLQGPVSGSFTYRNDGPNDGVSNLSFEVWASLDTTLSPATDHLVDSGSGLAPLAFGDTSPAIPFGGNWPLRYGSYYVIVRIASGDEGAPGNNAVASAGTNDVGIYDEEPSESNGNYYDVTSGSANAYDPGIVLQPGAQVLVRGTGTAADVDPDVDSIESSPGPGATTNDDIIAFDTGSANYVTFTWTLDSAVPEDLALFVMYGDNLFYTGVGGNLPEITYRFLVDAPNTKRWVDLENSGQADIGTYSLVISAE